MSEFTDLDRLSDEEIKTLWSGIQHVNQTTAGHALVRRAAEEARNQQNRSKSARMPANFDPLSQLNEFVGSDENQE
jgi:hypothetical protein